MYVWIKKSKNRAIAHVGRIFNKAFKLSTWSRTYGRTDSLRTYRVCGVKQNQEELHRRESARRAAVFTHTGSNH